MKIISQISFFDDTLNKNLEDFGNSSCRGNHFTDCPCMNCYLIINLFPYILKNSLVEMFFFEYNK